MKSKSLKMKLIGFAAAMVLALPVGAAVIGSATTAEAGATIEYDCPPIC